MKRSMKLAEWARLIEQRVESGETIKAWCEEQGIPRRLYYYWQNRVCEEMISSVALNYSCVPGIVPVSDPQSAAGAIRTDTPSFAKIPINSFQQIETNVPAMKICLSGAECEIYNGADADVVERALLALGKI